MSVTPPVPGPRPVWRRLLAYLAAPLAPMFLISLLMLLGAMDEDETDWTPALVGLGVVYLLLVATWSAWMSVTAFLLRRLGAAWEARWVVVSTALYGSAMAAIIFFSDSDFRDDAGFGVFMVIFVLLMNLAMAAAFKFITALPWRVIAARPVEDVFS